MTKNLNSKRKAVAKVDYEIKPIVTLYLVADFENENFKLR